MRLSCRQTSRYRCAHTNRRQNRKTHRIEWQTKKAITSHSSKAKQKKPLCGVRFAQCKHLMIVPCVLFGCVHMSWNGELEERLRSGKRVNIKCVSTLSFALIMPAAMIIRRENSVEMASQEMHHKLKEQHTHCFHFAFNYIAHKQIFTLALFAQLHCLRLSHVFHLFRRCAYR